jgi:putative SOS response-associated peptidase YedK
VGRAWEERLVADGAERVDPGLTDADRHDQRWAVCGRYVVESSPEVLAERFGVDDIRVTGAEPDYNVAPGTDVMVIRERDEHRVLSRVRWGLVPTWVKDPSVGPRLVNVRAESLFERFGPTAQKRRCLVPADGFYEWGPAPPAPGSTRHRSRPYYVHRSDGAPLPLAGLWEVWRIPEGHALARGHPDGWLRTCTIITTGATGRLAPIHERMPVRLAEPAWARWLDPRVEDPRVLAALLDPADPELRELEVRPVVPLVNRVANNGPELLAPAVVETLFHDSSVS